MNFSIAVYTFWVQCNYSLIANRLKSKSILNEDAFHDALIDLYDTIYSCDSITADELKNLFNKAYRQFDKRQFRDNMQYLHFEPIILDLIVTENDKYSEDDGDSEQNMKRAYSRLKRVADRILPIEDFKILVLYETHDSITMDGLSLYTGMSSSTLYGKLRRMKKILKDNYGVQSI